MKEKCECCNKNILFGQQIIECKQCSQLVIHAKCLPKSNFSKINSKLYCSTCSHKIPPRYNPYKSIIETDPLNDDSDNFNECYNQELLDASNILEKCKYTQSKSIDLSNTNFNTYFQNIDGNKTNFDTLASEVALYKGGFSVIGICETNINSDQKEMYILDDYNSFYSDKNPEKATGTGVAIYVNNSFNSKLIPDASVTHEHMESIFVELSDSKEKINVGVIYRPPNSKIKDFLEESKNLLKTIPKCRTYLMGDFNLNLLKSESNSDISSFEDIFMSEGFFPLISLATHCRSLSHQSTCIDNIFTNRIEDVHVSGVLEGNEVGHMPIFSQSNFDLKNNTKQKQKQTQFYSFCKKNTENLLELLKEREDELIGSDPSCPDFSSFSDTFTRCIDETCKLDIPKTTTRNAVNNPWITDSIINAIEEKDILYHDWKKPVIPRSHMEIKHCTRNLVIIAVALNMSLSQSNQSITIAKSPMHLVMPKKLGKLLIKSEVNVKNQLNHNLLLIINL